jgi:hypothetical protein
VSLLARLFDHEHDVVDVVAELSQPEHAVQRRIASEVVLYKCSQAPCHTQAADMNP